VLPATFGLAEAHDIGESLQVCPMPAGLHRVTRSDACPLRLAPLYVSFREQKTFEQLPFVERAFVHVDWDETHAVPEHANSIALLVQR
jgi:hypothetical protein